MLKETTAKFLHQVNFSSPKFKITSKCVTVYFKWLIKYFVEMDTKMVPQGEWGREDGRD
jgi:hypothetical protein